MHLTKEKSFYKSLLVLAVPMILQNLITYLVGFADNLMIGTLGDSVVSGVYMAGQVQTTLQVISFGIEGTVLLLASQYWGKRDTETIRKITSIGFRLCGILGAVTTAVCLLFPEAVVQIFTREESVVSCGKEYLFAVALSFLFFCMTQALIVSMRSVENARIGFLVSLVSLVVNVSLNYLLIFGKAGFPELGVTGAGIATVISRIVEFLVIFFYVRFWDKKLRYRFSMLARRDPALFRDFVRYGVPLMAGQLVWGCNLIANSKILGNLSEGVMTAASLANNVNNMIYVVMNGMAGAVGILTGKTVGAGKLGKIREYSVTVQILFFLLGLLSCGLVLLIRGPFISLYNISEEAVSYSFQFIGVLSVTIIGTAYQYPCLFGLVKSGGDVGFVFKNDTIFVFGVVIPLSVLTLLLGCPPWVIFLCLKSDQILKCAVAFFKIRRYDWMKNLTREETRSVEEE